MKNKLVNIVEEINHKINKTIVEDEQGQAAYILQAIDEMFPHSVANTVTQALGREFSYKGNMLSHMSGDALIFKLENASMLEGVHVKVEYVSSRTNYCIKLIHNYASSSAQLNYTLLELNGIVQEQLDVLSTLVDEHKFEMKDTYVRAMASKQLQLKSTLTSNEIVAQTYEDKLRKMGTNKVNYGN